MIRAQPEFVTGYPLQFAGGKNSISKIERNYADFTFAVGKRKAQLFVFEASYTACNFRFYPAQDIFPLFTHLPLIVHIRPQAPLYFSAAFASVFYLVFSIPKAVFYSVLFSSR